MSTPGILLVQRELDGETVLQARDKRTLSTQGNSVSQTFPKSIMKHLGFLEDDELIGDRELEWLVQIYPSAGEVIFQQRAEIPDLSWVEEQLGTEPSSSVEGNGHHPTEESEGGEISARELECRKRAPSTTPDEERSRCPNCDSVRVNQRKQLAERNGWDEWRCSNCDKTFEEPVRKQS